MAAPGDLPNSAEYALVTTLNSPIESTEGRDTCVVSSCTFSEIELLSRPSSRKLLCSERTPWTFTPPVRPAAVLPACSVYRSPWTPAASPRRSSQLRSASGRLATSGWLMTVPSVACSVLTSGEVAWTVTLCSTVPTDMTKSRRARWPTSRFTLPVLFLNPESSTSTTYEPGISPPMTYVPCASVTDTAATLVAALRAVTVAPGTTALDVSFTVPVSAARSTCAAAVGTWSSNAARTASRP